MTEGWILFVTFIVIGIVDLIMGVIFSRTPGRAVGEAPSSELAQNSPQARRFIGRTMIFSAFLLWGLAAASAYGLLAPSFALPMFGGPAS